MSTIRLQAPSKWCSCLHPVDSWKYGGHATVSLPWVSGGQGSPTGQSEAYTTTQRPGSMATILSTWGRCTGSGFGGELWAVPHPTVVTMAPASIAARRR